MSMPASIISCELCDFTCMSSKIWGDFAYIADGAETPLNRQLGWCHACKTFEPVEDFADYGETLDLLISTERKLSASLNKKRKVLYHLLFPRNSAITMLGHICRQQTDRLALINNRKNSERCLTCGSKNIELRSDELSPLTEPVLDIKKWAGFRHPECGGAMQIKAYDIWLNIAFEPRRYTYEGKLL